MHKNCEICGKDMIYYPHMLKIGRGKYCSRKCAISGIAESLKGKKQSKKTRLKRSISMTGQKRSLEFRKARMGHRCHLWKGGVWKKNRREYDKYSKTAEWGYWRNAVFKRDDYVCQDCKKSGAEIGRLEPHHIIPVREILINKQYNLIYDVSNGITLCRKCHQRTFKKK